MSKEIEKPFKCNVCALSFTNEDHLQVHKKRHEMSLNLSKGNAGTSNNESFVDETPTPTRFIRNCEEVGLFQDLQNVNPFDEQFVKAASATPSSESAGFDFNFSFRHTNNTTLSEDGAGEGVSTDSLNTPQVFAFQPTTPLIAAHRSSASKDGGNESSHSSQKLTQPHASVRQKHVLDLSINKPEEHEPEAKKVTPKAKRLILATKNKSNLRLNLSPQELQHDDDAIKSPDDIDDLEINSEGNTDEKRVGLLERNRAAASRSRERRKRYISALEIKCATLQQRLNHVQADLVATKAENSQLKEELKLHNSCSVSLQSTRLYSPVMKNTIIASPSVLCRIPSTSSQFDIEPTTPITPVSIDLALMSTPTTTVKRGRPKRGFEKRVSDLSFLPLPTSSSEPNAKIQILPISAYKRGLNAETKIILLNPGTGT